MMAKKIVFYLMCCALFLSVFGCASRRTVGNSANVDITTDKWVLVSVRADVQDDFISPKLDPMPTLQIDKEGVYSGNDGCNNFRGSLTFTGDSIHFFSAVSTLRACLDNQGVDGLLRAVFEQTNSYSIEKDQLVLKKDGEALAIYKR